MRKKYIIMASAAAIMLIGFLVACNGAEGERPAHPSDMRPDLPSGSADGGQDGGWGELRIDTTDLNGASVTSDDFSKNKLTILNIWATWCPPCIGELPELQKISETFAERGVQVVGVLQDGVTELGAPHEKTVENALALLKDANADYVVVLPDETLTTEFISRMQYFPTTFFIDSEGLVVHTAIGAKDFEDWSDEINEILAEIS
jgi:thiol-disulfide isomerase/thioredoxin